VLYNGRVRWYRISFAPLYLACLVAHGLLLILIGLEQHLTIPQNIKEAGDLSSFTSADMVGVSLLKLLKQGENHRIKRREVLLC